MKSDFDKAREEYLNDYKSRNNLKEKYTDGTSPSADKLVKDLNLIKNAGIYTDDVIKTKMLNLISTYENVLTKKTIDNIRHTFGLDELEQTTTKISEPQELVSEVEKSTYANAKKNQSRLLDNDYSLDDYKCANKPQYRLLNLYELYAKKESLNLLKNIGYISLPIFMILDVFFFSDTYKYDYQEGTLSIVWVIIIVIFETKIIDYIRCVESRIEILKKKEK